jgi:hypothetical protein
MSLGIDFETGNVFAEGEVGVKEDNFCVFGIL